MTAGRGFFALWTTTIPSVYRSSLAPMHLVQQPNDGPWRQVYDVTECSDCGADFTRVGTFEPRHHPCAAHSSSHWELICKTCRTSTWDSWCPLMELSQNPLEGHRVGPDWDDVQAGPVLNLGEN